MTLHDSDFVYTLIYYLLNYVKHMKKYGGQVWLTDWHDARLPDDLDLKSLLKAFWASLLRRFEIYLLNKQATRPNSNFILIFSFVNKLEIFWTTKFSPGDRPLFIHKATHIHWIHSQFHFSHIYIPTIVLIIITEITLN